ncbi:MAG: hypothetical protein HOP16_17410 [Acidobacteria bacterium]|nr:hypothetical protein [Acidobacteriota bacterium]
MSAEDDAELAERYGWINRALPSAALGEFVRSLAHRIAGFPGAGRAILKDRVNAIALAPADDFHRDLDLFLQCARNPETERLIRVALTRGFQAHKGEMALGLMVGDLWRNDELRAGFAASFGPGTHVHSKDWPDIAKFRSLMMDFRQLVSNDDASSLNRVCNLLFKHREAGGWWQ